MSLIQSLIPSLHRHDAHREAPAAAEPSVKPAYGLKETADGFGLTVHLPGVSRDGLEFTADDTELRIVGRRAWKQPEGWTAIHRESAAAPFELVLTHDHAVDLDKIQAELADGVLRIALPKAEALKPRKIAVN
jgi:HSP20 family protein